MPFSADETDQIAFDMRWRKLTLRHQADHGPGEPLYFPTSAMRGWLRYHLYRWESGEIDETEFKAALRRMLQNKETDE